MKNMRKEDKMSKEFKMVRLGDCAKVVMGQSPSSSSYNSDGEGTPFYQGNADFGVIYPKVRYYCTEPTKFADVDSVLMSVRAPIGALNIANSYCCIGRGLCAISGVYGVSYFKYLYYYLLKKQTYIQSLGTGSTFKAVTGKVVNDLSIPLPNIEKQQEIAAVLDKASELVEKRKAQLAELDALAESIFYDMFGDPVTNEKGWKKLTIEELVVKGKNAIKRGPFGGALKKEIFVDEGYLVYEQYHALNNDFSFGRYFITEDKYNELSGFAVDSNDIIISCSGVNLGKLAVIPENHKEGIINQALLKITLDNNIITNSLFVKIFTNDNFKDKYFGTNRGCAIPNFPPMSDFKQFAFICPPLQLQQQFAERIEKIEQQKQKVKAALKESEDLFQRLMQDMFNPEYHNS